MNKLKSIFTRVLTALLFLFGASQISLVYAANPMTSPGLMELWLDT